MNQQLLDAVSAFLLEIPAYVPKEAYPTLYHVTCEYLARCYGHDSLQGHLMKVTVTLPLPISPLTAYQALERLYTQGDVVEFQSVRIIEVSGFTMRGK